MGRYPRTEHDACRVIVTLHVSCCTGNVMMDLSRLSEALILKTRVFSCARLQACTRRNRKGTTVFRSTTTYFVLLL